MPIASFLFEGSGRISTRITGHSRDSLTNHPGLVTVVAVSSFWLEAYRRHSEPNEKRKRTAQVKSKRWELVPPDRHC